MGRWDDYDYYKPSRPKEARGGIKAQSQRGDFGKNWWAKRWVAVLEGFRIGARLNRGKSYARSGQVLSIAVDKGIVKARVQGSRSTPYKVDFKVKTLSPDEWKKVIAALYRQAIFMAKLLSGEMPQDIEKTFQEVGLSLFPERVNDLTTNCSCPDYSNPCKHIAAVYYLLGEEFDRDPFLLFKLRGMQREELVTGLVSFPPPAAPSPAPGLRPHGDVGGSNGVSASSEPVSADPVAFWQGENLPEDFWGEVHIPFSPAALLRQLGNFPFWQGRQGLLGVMEKIYDKASPAGMEIFLGDNLAKR